MSFADVAQKTLVPFVVEVQYSNRLGTDGAGVEVENKEPTRAELYAESSNAGFMHYSKKGGTGSVGSSEPYYERDELMQRRAASTVNDTRTGTTGTTDTRNNLSSDFTFNHVRTSPPRDP